MSTQFFRAVPTALMAVMLIACLCQPVDGPAYSTEDSAVRFYLGLDALITGGGSFANGRALEFEFDRLTWPGYNGFDVQGEHALFNGSLIWFITLLAGYVLTGVAFLSRRMSRPKGRVPLREDAAMKTRPTTSDKVIARRFRNASFRAQKRGRITVCTDSKIRWEARVWVGVLLSL